MTFAVAIDARARRVKLATSGIFLRAAYARPSIGTLKMVIGLKQV